MTTKLLRRCLTGVAVEALLYAGCPAFAQSETATSPAVTAAQEESQTESAGAGDIIVTANKRAQSLKDVGLTITALSGAELKQRQVANLDDLTRTVPNLSFQPTAFSTPVFTLRGVGFYDSSLSSYPAVATYVDEVPLPFPSLTTHMAFDLERMEVLKGPQGTLFGASSTGGAINFISAKPTDQFEAGADITYGRFNRVQGNAYVSGPIAANLNGRIAINGARADDWQYSQSRPGDTSGKERYIAGRITLDWHPSDTLKFVLSANAYKAHGDTQAPQYKTYSPQRPVAASPFAGGYATFPFAPDNARAADWDTTMFTNAPGSTIDGQPRGRQTMVETSLRADWEFVPDLRLTSITSYAYYKRNMTTEQDGTPFLGADYTALGNIKTFNQELRIANSARSQFRWILGGNYEHTNTFESFVDYWKSITLNTPQNFSLDGYQARSSQWLRNYAAFANAEYDLTEQLTLKGGLRYTENRRRQNECSFDNGDGSMNALINFFGNRLAGPRGIVFTPVAGKNCIEIDDVTWDGTPATFQAGEFKGTLNEHNVSWRAGIDFKPNRDTLLYFNVAKGYKAGTLAFIGGTNFGIHKAVPQEALLDFEGGAKLQLFDRKLSINMAGFYYKYDDKQLRSRIPDPNFGALNSLVSVPKSTLYGVEIEGSLRPVEGLSLSGAFTYTHSNIDEYFGFPASGVPPTVTTVPIDFSGSLLPYVSKYQATASANYRWDMGGVRPFIGASYSYRSSQLTSIGGSKGIVTRPEYRSQYPFNDTFKIPGYGLLDLRAGVTAEDESWSVSVFGKNVTNKYYFNNIVTVYDGAVRYTGMPATYGVTIGFKFH